MHLYMSHNIPNTQHETDIFPLLSLPSSLLEINRVRSTLFQINGSEKKPLQLPEPEGPVTSKSDKIYVPVDKYPDVSLF